MRCESNNFERSIISLLQDEFFVREHETQDSDIIKCVPAVEPTYEYWFGPQGVN